MNKKSRILPYVTAGMTIFLWASSFPAVRYSLLYYSPEAVMVFRFLVASAVLALYCWIKKVPLPKKADVPLFIWSGFTGFFVYMWAFNAGTALVLSGISSFIISTVPIFTLLLSIIFLKEKANLSIWLGVGISLIGIAIIGVTQITEMRMNIGIWLLLVASISASVYVIIQRRILQKYTTIQATAYSIFFGTAFMCIFLPKFISEFSLTYMSANIIVVYLGVFPAALAYFFFGYALSKAEKTIYVTNFLYLIPFVSSILAFWWLGEEMPMLAFLGGIVAIAGMIIANSSKNKV